MLKPSSFLLPSIICSQNLTWGQPTEIRQINMKLWTSLDIFEKKAGFSIVPSSEWLEKRIFTVVWRTWHSTQTNDRTWGNSLKWCQGGLGWLLEKGRVVELVLTYEHGRCNKRGLVVLHFLLPLSICHLWWRRRGLFWATYQSAV